MFFNPNTPGSNLTGPSATGLITFTAVSWVYPVLAFGIFCKYFIMYAFDTSKSFWSGNVGKFGPIDPKYCTISFQKYAPFTKVFVACTGNANLCRVTPCYHDDASCFDASWLSFNTSATDFLYYTLIKVAIYSESHGSWRLCEERRGGAYVRDKINIRANNPAVSLVKVTG